MGQDTPKGSIMVIGGGIAGIETALSAAQAGYGVYLVEHTPSLGGMIPKLHRIYPLCACCKLDPRVAACEQDPNINVMLNTRVLNVSGRIGEFTITLQREKSDETIKTGAVVIAAGIETFDPSKYDTYSYGRFPNVLTSVEYEHLQKPLGPEKGVVKRPSDGRIPKKIAWLQCVGSRDLNRCDAPYCSSVCCMHALKEAVNTKDFDEDIETTIFYMDMRTHGKGYEDYLNSAMERGVRLVRCRIHTIDRIQGTDDMEIVYADDTGGLRKEVFNMVILSVGLRPSSEAIKLAEKIGINLTEDDYISARPFKPVSTSTSGIFFCGGVGGPLDIGQTLTQSSAAVSEIIAVLAPAPFFTADSRPKISKAKHKKPRVLLAYFLCPGMDPQLGTEIEAHAKRIPGVIATLKLGGEIMAPLTESLRENGANRLVFASCTPEVHKRVIEDSLRWAGVNPYLYETVDLRVLGPETGMEQLRDRIRMGVARSALISPPDLKDVPVIKRALVVGGGVAGLESALALTQAGYPVTLVEKEKQIGGHGRHVRSTWQGYDVQEYLKALFSSVQADPSITVMTETVVKENKGFAGNFRTTVQQNGKNIDIAHGVTLLAPGGDPVRPSEYLYGRHKHAYLWSEISDKMIQDPSSIETAGTAVFIQCVGSREPERPHCSNVCCSFAVRTAVDLKTKNPAMNIYILYREMRTFGERENLYRDARDKGVVFIRYDLENKPVVETADAPDKLRVTVHDPILGRTVRITADFVSLQTAIVGTNNQRLADIFSVDLDSNGFFAESPEKLKPMKTTREGIYLAGLAHYPKDTGESIAQAKGAAAQALEILCKDSVQVGGPVAEVNPEKCAVCCTCVRTCPFKVPYIDHDLGAAYIDPGLCQGCGMCVAECPGKAIVMNTCSDRMLVEVPSMLLAGASEL
ncbi:MAG: FAD-dependent oxidoreductase [Desulfatiglandaceae bacterium]